MSVTGVTIEHHYVPGWPSWPATCVAVVLLLPLLTLFAVEAPDGRALPPTPTGATFADDEVPFAWSAFTASLAVAAGAACLSVAAGVLIAIALELTDLPCRGLWATTVLVAFASPSAVWALGQVYCYGSSGLIDRWLGDAWRPWLTRFDSGHYFSSSLVLAEIYAPLAMLLAGRGLARLPQAGWEAARLLLPPVRRWRWVLGAIRAELAAAWLLAFALGAGNFAVPHVLQCRLFPIEVYLRLTNYLDSAGASRSALALLAVTLLAAAVVALVERRRRVATLRGEAAAERYELGWRAWPLAAALGSYLILTVLLPIAAMVAESGSLARFLSAVREAAPETANTLSTAFTAAALAVVGGAVVAGAAARKASVALETVAMVPIAIPAIVFGLAYSQFYNHAWPIDLAPLGDGNALVVLALTARAWPFAARAMMSGERRVAPECHEAAWLAGLSRWRRAWWVSGPLLAQPALAAALIGYLLTVGEVEISQLLCAPGRGTLALRLFTFMHFGPVHVAASLALLQLAVAILPVLAYFLLTNRCLGVV